MHTVKMLNKCRKRRNSLKESKGVRKGGGGGGTTTTLEYA